MKILSISIVSLVGALISGVWAVWNAAVPQVIAGEHLKGGCKCCITAKFHNCAGITCFNGCNFCKNDPPGLRLCVTVGTKCTSWFCNYENCTDEACDNDALCKNSLSKLSICVATAVSKQLPHFFGVLI